MQHSQANDSTTKCHARQQVRRCRMCKKASPDCKALECVFFCQGCLKKLLIPSASASSSSSQVEIMGFPSRKFDVFVEAKNDNDMSLIGAFYSATKKAMSVAYIGPKGSVRTNLWMFSFESSEDFTTLLAKVKPSIGTDNYKIWSTYALKVDKPSGSDKVSNSLLAGYLLGCASFVDFKEDIASFCSEEGMMMAKESLKEMGMNARRFGCSFLSDLLVTFKLNAIEGGKIPAFECLKEFRPNAVMFECNPFLKMFTGEGIMYLPSEEEGYEKGDIEDEENDIIDDGTTIVEKEEEEEEEEEKEKEDEEDDNSVDTSENEDDDDDIFKDEYSQKIIRLEELKEEYPYTAFFKNFDSSVDEKDIEALFKEYDTDKFVYEIKDNKIYGYAFFKGDENLQDCIKKFKSSKYGKSASIEKYDPKLSSSPQPVVNSSGPYKVYFKGFLPGTEEDEVKEIFSDCANEAFEMKRDTNKKTTGSGFITFGNKKDMDNAIEKYNKIILGRTLIEVRVFNSSKVRPKKAKLCLHVEDYYCNFVTHLPHVNKKYIMELFNEYHPLGVKIFDDGKNVVVFFANKEEQIRAVEEMNGKAVEGKEIVVKPHNYKYKTWVWIDELPVDPSLIEKREYDEEGNEIVKQENIEEKPDQPPQMYVEEGGETPHVWTYPEGEKNSLDVDGEERKREKIKERKRSSKKQNVFQTQHKKEADKGSIINDDF